MSTVDRAVVLIALGSGACWLVLAAFLLGGRLLYDVKLGSVRTEPGAWPARGGEGLPKLAAPALSGAEVGTLAGPTRRAPVAPPRAPVAPRRVPVAPTAPARVPALPEPVVARSRPKRIRPFREPVAETGSHVAA